MHKNTGEKWDESTQLESIELRLSRPLDSRRGDSIAERDINMLPVTRGEMQSSIEGLSIVHDNKVTYLERISLQIPELGIEHELSGEASLAVFCLTFRQVHVGES